ncbi:assimilatory sulfite reductase (NADPH) flavoprotein subunit [Ursidibacter sp. B-7004-1]
MSNDNLKNFSFPPETAKFLSELDSLELAWLSGFCWAKAKNQGSSLNANLPQANETSVNTVIEPLSVTILSASQTGNAKSVASKLAERLNAEGIQAKLVSAKDYKAKTIAEERHLFLVTSTQGEGEPPEEGVVLFKLLNGKKAPNLNNLEFAVLGLGDSSYPKFCQAGKDFDQRFAELGGKRLLDRVDADLDFAPTAEQWIEQVVSLLKQKNSQAQPSVQIAETVNSASESISIYTKESPFEAPLLTNQKITARQAEKDVRHIELDLAGSGLRYTAGDALGVWFENDPALVAEIISTLHLNPDENVEVAGKTLSLSQALQKHFELTQNTPAFVKQYAELSGSRKLSNLIKDNEKFNAYVQNTPLVAVLNDYPTKKLTALQFISLLRPLAPRLYSISSSQAEVGEEVHLSVGVVRFEHNGKLRSGAASSFLADRAEEQGSVRVFVEKNENFRLPNDPSKPIIMIGSGTGIAPFRAFVQQRAAEEAEGKNWLIFGNQRFTQDFLYQTEWQQFVKDGFLHQYDFAWSRDQEQKIYVQHKILEQAELVWQWIQQGAYIYVCGDASRMAKDVENALLEVIATQGKLSSEDAEEFLNEMREQKRYQRDVY